MEWGDVQGHCSQTSGVGVMEGGVAMPRPPFPYTTSFPVHFVDRTSLGPLRLVIYGAGDSAVVVLELEEGGSAQKWNESEVRARLSLPTTFLLLLSSGTLPCRGATATPTTNTLTQSCPPYLGTKARAVGRAPHPLIHPIPSHFTHSSFSWPRRTTVLARSGHKTASLHSWTMMAPEWTALS